MTAVFILHHTGTGASAAPNLLCMQYGYTMMRIDTSNTLLPGPTVFSSLQAALDDIRFIGWTWYFFDANATSSLHSVGHQKDHAVYVFGHDIDGWDRPLDALPGALVYIPSDIGSNAEMTATMAAQTAIVHRYFWVNGR